MEAGLPDKEGGASGKREGEEFGILNFECWMLSERSQANDRLGNPSNWPTPFAPVQKLLDEEFSQEQTEGTEVTEKSVAVPESAGKRLSHRFGDAADGRRLKITIQVADGSTESGGQGPSLRAVRAVEG
jgi:hypothetical protein